jgi:hypothetical protein
MLELSFILYIFAALISVPGIFFVFGYMKMYLAGGIAAIGLLVLFIFFGMQYYNIDGSYTTQAAPAAVAWPPAVYMCPDFLSLYKDPSGTTLYCVDTVGVSTSGAQQLQKYDPVTAAGSTTPSIPQQFKLFLKDDEFPAGTSGIINGYDASKCNRNTKDRKECLKQQCMLRGLTWSGFWDGVQLLGTTEPPKPA